MVNWYVDFTLDENGTGTTYSGAWNQFTATEAATVSGGDSIWFRRCDPGNGAKIITIKEGDIKYIGWPKEGDVLYDVRPVDPRSLWDFDSIRYVYQRLSIYEGCVHSLESSNKFYRWYFYNYYNGSHTNYSRVVDIVSKNNVSVYHSYIYNYVYTDTYYDYLKPLRVENGNNIYFKDTIIRGPSYTGYTYYNYNQIFKFYRSTIIFDDCVFKTSSVFDSNTDKADNANEVSYINYCTLHFNNCIFDNHVLCSSTSATTSNNYCVLAYNSTMYFNNTKLEHNRTDNVSNNIFNRSPHYWFRVDNCTINMINNCGYSSQCDMAAGFYVCGSSSINCSDFQVNIEGDSVNQNIVFDLWDIDSVVINNISGSVDYYSNVDSKNYFIGLNGSVDFEYFMDRITISNVKTYVGDIIEKLRYISSNRIISINNNSMFKNFDFCFGTPIKINVDNSEIGGINLYYSSYNTGNAYYGSKHSYKNLKVTNSIIKKYRALYMGSSFITPDVVATIYNCKGSGAYPIFDDDTGDECVLTLNAFRNKGFSSVGSLYCAKNKIFNSSFNMELNTHRYCYAGHIENSRACRTNGADYSIKAFKEVSDDILYVPEFGYETIWVKLPDSGTYIVTAHILYNYITACTLSLSDIYFDMHFFDSEGISFCIKSDNLVNDSSTWSIDGIKIKLTCSVTVSNGQICPIRFYIPGYYEGLIIYIDPKLDVTLV